MAATQIIVIGMQRPDEALSLYMIGIWLEEHREAYGDLATRLRDNVGLDVYDMSTRPEKGDALDAIGDDTAAVVALHLFGIDKLPGGRTAQATALDPATLYNRDNINLLERCMERGIPLIAVGDQPWKGMEKRTQMYGAQGEPMVFLYETKAAFTPTVLTSASRREKI